MTTGLVQFSLQWGETCCHSSSSVPTRTHNQTADLELLLTLVRPKATGARSIFAKTLLQMKTASVVEIYRVANMSHNRPVRFQVHLSLVESEASTWSIADIDHMMNQLERKIYGVTSNEQVWFTMGFSRCEIESMASWDTISTQQLQTTITQCSQNFSHRKFMFRVIFLPYTTQGTSFEMNPCGWIVH